VVAFQNFQRLFDIVSIDFYFQNSYLLPLPGKYKDTSHIVHG
jgi:hypothetical protein